jgi:hypothetical protein
VPGEKNRRPSAAYRRDALAVSGARRRSVAGRAAGGGPGAHPHWATDSNWRKCQAKLNAIPQFTTEIDGVDIHFIHVNSPHEKAMPLIVMRRPFSQDCTTATDRRPARPGRRWNQMRRLTI